MKRVTGIGGIFFKANDAPALHAWYKRISARPSATASLHPAAPELKMAG